MQAEQQQQCNSTHEPGKDRMGREGGWGGSEDFLKGFRSLVRPLFRDAALGPWAAELLTRSARHFPRFFDFPFYTKTRGGTR